MLSAAAYACIFIPIFIIWTMAAILGAKQGTFEAKGEDR